MNSRHITIVNRFNIATAPVVQALGTKKFVPVAVASFLPNTEKKDPQYVYADIDHAKSPITNRKIVVKIVTWDLVSLAPTKYAVIKYPLTIERSTAKVDRLFPKLLWARSVYS